jgi:far upstream element-binding protein
VGRIIGRGGETVKMLQRKYNASVQINQSTDPMDITIIASPHEAEACQAEINHIIMHPDMPMGGGGGMGPGFRGGPGGGGMGPRPGYGGGGMPGPYGMGMPGMYGAMPYGGMMPPYGGYGMGMPPAAMPAYGGYAMGGGYDAAAYGGAGGYGGGAAVGAQQQYGGPAGGVGAGGAAASVWQAIPDDQGRTYYYNSQTGVSQWEKPADMP